MTSQSIQMVRSPRRARSVTARRLRPIRRWISWVRPLCRPLETSRVDAGQSRTRQHAVLAGDPAFAAIAHETRDSFFDRGSADDTGIAHFNQDGTLRSRDEFRGEDDGAKLVERAIIGTIEHANGL